ncbi:hypothetical protein [Aureimonas leprariae]|uniref:DUF2336 domain-containing protein n=1 Tax=Plantimonas leprariae TaxID=2615207 RepID=A0A7V7TWG9_9HYPH|nr:hypothetical protein [Aureimonas leprariae]KAB0679963.1 hypothetical protein F6X38_10340 [Aureimonas leprariae]
MTDASPRIFRNLEKSGGRDSFDDIVLAAVADYAALERPSAAQSRDFGRLVAPLYDRTAAETRRRLAAALSPSPALPRVLVEKLLAEPAAVAAPFLLASPLLTPEDLAALAVRRDPGLKKILKARNAPPKSEKPATSRRRKTVSPATAPDAAAPVAPRRLSSARQTALLSAGTPEPAPSLANLAPAVAASLPTVPEPQSAEEALALLRKLVLSGRPRAAARVPAPAPSPAARTDLMGFALARDAEGFHSLLANKLLLGPEALATIRADRSGRELAAALKATGAERADALTMLMMLNEELGSDVAAFETMGAFYGSLDASECAARFDVGRMPVTPALQPTHVETEAPHRAEPRRVFGRRISLPAGVERRRRNP